MLQPRLLFRPNQWLCATRQTPSTSLSVFRTYATANVSEEQPSAEFTTSPQTFVERPSTAAETNVPIYKPIPRTPGLRHLRRPIHEHLWKGRAYLPLTIPRKGQHIGGRNNTGKIAIRHRGGGHKRRLRIIDFSRHTAGEHHVERIEYDPGRSAHIALIKKGDAKDDDKKSFSYILASEGMRAGDKVQSYRRGVPKSLIASIGGVKDPAIIAAKTAWRGNCLPLHMIPTGTLIYNVGLYPGKKGQLCRSAGTYATVLGNTESQIDKYKIFVTVKLQSGEIRRIHKDACATIGIASNSAYTNRQLGKAGRSRWLGIRPTVRGVAMNASDHPHGGGRGKSKGNVHPVSIWGRTLAKGGYKTRKKTNINRSLVTERPRHVGPRSKLKNKQQK